MFEEANLLTYLQYCIQATGGDIMKKLAIFLLLLVLSAPLLLKSKMDIPSRFAARYGRVSSLVKEYLRCGPECLEAYKDAILEKIASLKNINKQQALKLIIFLYVTWKLKGYIKQQITKPPKVKL